MDIISAMRRQALDTPTIAGYVAGKVFRHTLEEPVEGTGGIALVLVKGPGWACPPYVGTQEYPIVWGDIYADPDRDALGNYSALNAEDKAYAVAKAMKTPFHQIRNQIWGAIGSNPGLLVINSTKGAEPRIITHDQQHGGEIPLGQVVKLRTTWHIQCADISVPV